MMLKEKFVSIQPPQESVRPRLPLRNALCSALVLGITAAFGGDADFGGITSAEPLQIGAVAHKAYIDVDERGTEAAAATGVVIRTRAAVRPMQPVTMVVDRPFLFAIVDSTTGLPLFLGQVSHPVAS